MRAEILHGRDKLADEPFHLLERKHLKRSIDFHEEELAIPFDSDPAPA